MNEDIACHLLGIDKSASRSEIESAKHKLLQALHPDKHPPAQKDVFTKMTRDIIEAAEFMEDYAIGQYLRDWLDDDVSDDDTLAEQVIFEEHPSDEQVFNSSSIISYKNRSAKDNILSAAVLKIDYDFAWQTTHHSLLGGESQTQENTGCILYLLVTNKTSKSISSFYVGQHSFLIDDRGHQYSVADTNFYWIDNDGKFNRHADFIAPKSRLDGILLFPKLRKGSKNFTRWFLRGQFYVDEALHKGSYDVQLV